MHVHLLRQVAQQTYRPKTVCKPARDWPSRCLFTLFPARTVQNSCKSLPGYGLMVHFRGSWAGRLFWLVLSSLSSLESGQDTSTKKSRS